MEDLGKIRPEEGHGEKPSDDQDRALTPEEKLEESLVDSMDGSDACSVTHPGDHGEPVPSSGFVEDDEEAARNKR